MKKKFLCFFSILTILIGICGFSFALETPTIDCEAGLLIDLDSGKVLFEKNADKQMYPASVTKVLTAILVVENCDLEDEAVASKEAILAVPSGYTAANIQIGERLEVKDLLNVLLIPSANDAANVLAEHVGGTMENFAQMMNEKAKELGCTGSNFVNANGVYNKNHYTTARDLAIIGKYAMKFDTIRQIVVQTKCELPSTDKYTKNDRIFTTTNELLIEKATGKANNYYYPYCTGLKTGYTSQSGNTFIATASKDNVNLILVLLNGRTTSKGLSQRYLDSIKLFDYGFNNYSLIKLQNKDSILKEIEISNASKSNNTLGLALENDISALISNETANQNEYLPTITLNDNLVAPIKKGEIVGSVEYDIDGIIYSSNLIANNNIEKYSFLKSTGSVFFTIIKILLVLIILFILLTIIIHITKSKERQRKRGRNNRYKY